MGDRLIRHYMPITAIAMVQWPMRAPIAGGADHGADAAGCTHGSAQVTHGGFILHCIMWCTRFAKFARFSNRIAIETKI